MNRICKRMLAVLLAVLLCGAMPTTFAEGGDIVSGTCGAEGANVIWNLDTSTGMLTISGTGGIANYVSRGTPWVSNCYSIKTVKIESGVTSIGSCAFFDCTNLTSVTIPDSVKGIGLGAFDECKSLTSVTIGNSVTSVGDYAFVFCMSLTSVTIPDSVEQIGESAFDMCTSLTDVYYAGSEAQWNAITIDDWGNDSLTSATIHYNSTGEAETTTILLWKNKKESGTCELTGSLDVPFNGDWFSRSATDYNQQLGVFCADISTLGYCPAANIKSELSNLGFTVPEGLINTQAMRDEVNYFIATKPVGGDLLVLVATIGSHDDQWYSNFDPNGTERETGKAVDRNYHLGFLDAKEYVYDILEKNIGTITSGYDKSHVKFLFTGHSRGAAAANLLAAQFIDDAQSGNGMAQMGNIYAYTFATPNVGLKKAINGDLAKYNCIFNVVNPEDFVTKVLPADWGYARYGVTYVLPSATNTESKYYKKVYLKNVQEFLAQHTDSKYMPYKVSGVYAGEAVTYSAVKLMTSQVSSVDDLYEKKGTWILYNGTIPMRVSPYSFFKNTMMGILANLNRCDTQDGAKKIGIAVHNIVCLWETLTPTKQSLFYDSLLVYFCLPVIESIITIAKDPSLLSVASGVYKLWKAGGLYFQMAHQAETYCAYMNTMGALTKSDGTNAFLHSVNCPVDVEVYEKETGELVGRIVDNKVDTTVAEQDNAIVMLVDGDSKMFWLPEDGDYEVKLIGNDTGTMDYTVSAVDSDAGETGRVNFFDVPITDGKVMTGDVTAEDFTQEEYTLTTDSGLQITATETDEEAAETFTISSTVTGDGYATDSLSAVSGDYVTLTATPNEGSRFIGWYENGALVSSSATYAFVVKSSRNLSARFDRNAYSVTWIVDGESVSDSAAPGDPILKPADPVKEGYTFAGWSPAVPATMPAEDMTFTAQFTKNSYTVTWNVEGRTTAQTVAFGDPIAKPADPVKEGYSFTGWSPAVPDVMPAENMTFTAQFTKNEEPPVGQVRSVSAESLTLLYKQGGTLQPVVTADSGVGYTVAYSGFDSRIVSIDANGKVTALKKGSTDVTVTAADEYGNTAECTCKVTVKYAWWQILIRIFLLGFLWY